MKTGAFILMGSWLTFSCTPTKINQYVKEGKVQHRDGRWVENYTNDEGELTAHGHYKKGRKVGVWNTFLQSHKFQKEVFRRDRSKTKFYHPNGRIKVRGQSKTETTDNFIHWYYAGDWKYYDDHGRLMYVKKYNKNQSADSISYIK